MFTVTTNESDESTTTAAPASAPPGNDRINDILARAKEGPTDARQLLGIDKPPPTLEEMHKAEAKEEEAPKPAPDEPAPAEEPPAQEPAPEDAREAARKERVAEAYARSARLDRELEKKKREIRAMEVRLAEREKEVSQQTASQWQERAKKDLPGVLKELGFDPDDWAADRVLGKNTPPPEVKPTPLPKEFVDQFQAMQQKIQAFEENQKQAEAQGREYRMLVDVYTAMNQLADDLPLINARKARGEQVDQYVLGRAKQLMADGYDVDYPALIKHIEETLQDAYLKDISTVKDHPKFSKVLQSLQGTPSKAQASTTAPKTGGSTEHKVSSSGARSPEDWEKLIGQVMRGEATINHGDFNDVDDSVGHIVERVSAQK